MKDELSYDKSGAPISRNGLIVILLVLAAAVVILYGVFSSSGGASKAAAEVIPGGGNVPTACASTMHYAAYDAPKGTNDFGPNESFGSTADAVARFNDKECSDPLFAAVHTEALRLGTNAKNLDAKATMALAHKYVANRKLWAGDVKAFNGQVESMTLASYDTSYETLGMMPGSNSSVMPRLIKSDQKVKLGQSLDITMKSGVTLHDRTACDLQLSVPEFTNVPPATPSCVPSSGNHYCGQPPATCTSNCTPHSGCKRNCSTPVCTRNCGSTTTPPSGCTRNCGSTTPPPGHKTCPCVTPTQVQIPVQESGYPTVYNSNAPSARPSQQPTQPVNTDAPAPPTGGGYNGGSTSQPGTTAPPVQVVPTDGPTATGDPGGF